MATGVPTTLPASWYTDPAILRLEQERIFRRSWQYVARADQVAEPRSYVAARAGDVPVVVLRDDEGKLRGFVNVCRHRGHEVVSGAGSRAVLQCPYHAWTYGLDGLLRTAPRADREPGFSTDGLGLLPVAVDTWGPWVFANPDPEAAPLAEHLGELPGLVAGAGLDLGTLRFRERAEWTVEANWKIVADNYLEGYHVPIAHPGLMRLYDYKAYTVELHDGYVSFDAPLRDKPSGNLMERAYQRLVSPMPGLPDEYTRVWRYIYIYPNTAIDLYPDQVWVWKLDSDGPKGTRDTAMLYRHPSASARTRLAQYFNRKVNALVGEEDVDLVANVQAGLESRGWEPGPLSGREAAVGWFADKIRADLGEDA